MKSLCFVIPYFTFEGTMPNYFQLWLDSCSKNETIDFLVFTDCDLSMYELPENLIIHNLTWEQMNKYIKKQYDFPIALENPYKLCDFRPAYGEIFREYLLEYDFWGYCDIDLIWGDIRSFITDEIFEQYERIHTRGHCSLYKNSEYMNTAYRLLPHFEYQNWKNVFSSEKNCCFDEWGGHCGGGVSYIFKKNGIKTYDSYDMADIFVKKGYFKINGKDINEKKMYLKKVENKVFLCNEKEMIEEVLYFHFQKRNITIKDQLQDGKWYFIAPGLFQSTYTGSRYFLKEIIYVLNYNWKRIKKKIRN